MTAQPDPPGPNDPGLVALVMLLRFHGIGADPAQIRHQCGTPAVGVADMIRCAKELGLKARELKTSWARLTTTPLPAIAALKDGGFLLLGKLGDDKIVVQSPKSPRPELMTKEELEAVWDGRIVLMTRRANLMDLSRRFDISWFLGAIHKYRAAIGRGAVRFVLPAIVRAGLAAVLPGGDRQGPGPSQPRVRSTCWSSACSPSRCSRPFSASCGPICSRTPPTGSTSSSARACSSICWRCRSPISRPAGSAIRSRACASWRTSATS